MLLNANPYSGANFKKRIFKISPGWRQPVKLPGFIAPLWIGVHTLGVLFLLTKFFKMNAEKEKQTMSLQVTDGLTVTVLPDSNHEFLIPTKDVAHGYGVSATTFRRHKQEHPQDLVEGKHFLSRVQNLNASGNQTVTPYKRTFWTKRGVIRMGFFIRSERAKLFRDWAEDLVISKTEQAQVQPVLSESVDKLVTCVAQLTMLLTTSIERSEIAANPLPLKRWLYKHEFIHGIRLRCINDEGVEMYCIKDMLKHIGSSAGAINYAKRINSVYPGSSKKYLLFDNNERSWFTTPEGINMMFLCNKHALAYSAKKGGQA